MNKNNIINYMKTSICLICAWLSFSCAMFNSKEYEMNVKYVVLSDIEYENILDKARDWADVKTAEEKDLLRDKIADLQYDLRKNFSKKWEEEDNWAVTWDFNYQYYTCGAIYSEKAFSREYIIQAIKAINLQKEPEQWAYHVVGEIMKKTSGKTTAEVEEYVGEFFIKNNIVYIPKSMQEKYRKMLGCNK